MANLGVRLNGEKLGLNILLVFLLVSCREVSHIDGKLSVPKGESLVVKDISGTKHTLNSGPTTVTVKDSGNITIQQGTKKVLLRVPNPRKLFRFNLELKASQLGQNFDLLGHQKTVLTDQGNRWIKKPCDGCPAANGAKLSRNCEGNTQWLEDYRVFQTQVELNFERGGRVVGRYTGLSVPFEQVQRVAETIKSTCLQAAKKNSGTVR